MRWDGLKLLTVVPALLVGLIFLASCATPPPTQELADAEAAYADATAAGCPECAPEVEPVEEENSGSGCDNCDPPTLGLNKSGDRRMVDGGFTCNGQTVDVDHYYTEFPVITNAVGTPLLCQFVIYEDTHADNIRHFEFAVGKRAGDSMSDVQGKITWDRDFKGVTSVSYDEELFRNVFFSHGLTKCMDESSTQPPLLY